MMIIWFGVLAWGGVLVFGPSVNDHRLRKHLRKAVCFSCDIYLVINEKAATVEWRGITTPWPWWPPHGHLMVGGQKRTLSNKVHECRTHRLFLEFNILTSTLKGSLWQALTTNVRIQQLIAKWMTYIWGKINNRDLHTMSMVKSTEIYLFFVEIILVRRHLRSLEGLGLTSDCAPASPSFALRLFKCSSLRRVGPRLG